MRLAQELYEGVSLKGRGNVGLITYLRTDSTRISEEADAACREYIRTQYGEQFVGNGVACVHRLDRPVEVYFGRMVSIADPETGKIRKQLRKWAPKLKPGESAAVCYIMEENEK